MRKAKATYIAPLGDDKTVTTGGKTFKDGESVDLNTDENPDLISALENNPHFDVTVGEEEKGTSEPKKKVGRPSKEEKAARDAADKKLADAKAAKDKADAELKARQVEIDSGTYPKSGAKAPDKVVLTENKPEPAKV